MRKAKKTFKQSMRLQVSDRLEATFSDLKETLGNGTFKKNIKKASKALVADIKKARKKKPSKSTDVKSKSTDVK